VLTANLVNCSLMVAALWHGTDRRTLLGWAAAVATLTLVRLGLWLYSRPRLADAGEAVRWGPRYTVGSTVSGLLWGSTAFLFISPENPTSLILVSFVIGGMAAGSVTGLATYLPAFYCYLLCSMVPFELSLLIRGDRLSLAMSGMGSVYAIGLVIIARNFNAALIRALVLNEENKRLLAPREEEVALRTADLRTANADLEREIGERISAETRAEEARAEAEQANMAKSRFLAAASHDLRQPLQSMYLFASSLHHFVTERKGIDVLLRIERCLDILKGMLDSLLDLSRLEVNVTEPQIMDLPIKPMLDDIVVAYGRIAASKGIELKAGEITDIQVHSDPNLLGRMVRNLVENAIRYTERGEIVLSSPVVGTRTVRISVEDTGIGIAPDQLDRIFEEFHQVGNPERDKARGLGLGLSIVQRLSAILGHPIEVRSQLGVGSIFSIEVPVADGDIPASEAAAEAVPAAAEGRRQVMVVDDDPLVLLALNTMFEQWGYEVIMAGSEEDAVAQMQDRGEPQLVVADYRLRNGRVGTDAIKGIRACCVAEVPSIVLTGETGTEWVKDAESLGALILHKPVTPHYLAYALKRLVGDGGVP